MQSQARWVTHEEVLHRTSRVLARVAGHIGQDLPFMKRIADELDFFHEAIHTMRDSDPIANLSIDKYNTARDTALEAVDSLVSRGRLDWEPAQRDGNSTRLVFAPGLDHPGTHGLCRLYKCLEADSEGSLAHDKELLRDLSPVQAAEFADSVSPLRRELGRILGHLTLKDRRATWDPIGSEKTQGHLNSLLDAIVKTWEKNRPPNRKKTSTPQLIGEAETVNLRMDGTWSRHAEGAGSFSLIFRFASPRTLQLAKVRVQVPAVLVDPKRWFSACHHPLRRDLCYNFVVNQDKEIGVDKNVKRTEPAPEFGEDAKEFSLREVLEFRELHYREKMVLCLRIARSVLDLYSTKWLEQDWGLDNIRVYGRKTENSSVLELRYPYLRLDLHRPSSSVPQGVFMPSQDSEASSDVSMDELLHRCPYALGLGVVLMQILLGDRLQNCTAIWNGSNELSLSDDIKVNVNDRMVQAMKLQQECQARFPCDWALLKAIAKCTDIGLFEAAESDHHRLFRDNVLLPLERAILQDHACGHTSDGLDQFLNARTADRAVLGSMDELFQDSGNDSGSRKRSYEVFSRDNSRISWESSSSAKHVSTLTANESPIDLTKKFLEPLQYISKSLFKINNRLKLDGFEPDDVWDGLVRVAILDTGCDFALEEIKKKIIGNNDGNLPRGVRAPGIVGWKDFVDLSRGEEKAMVDESENRHGTVMTRLLFQTMGLAKVYIGRVAKADREEGVSERVVEAIEWAVDKWKADIISISLSLENPTEQIRERIDAVGKRALILASAGNNRPPKRQPIAFPASSPSVICVHSHNGHGKPSEFTPLARNHSPNFQVIGQDINISGAGNAVQTVEGTSCSTAIAAGIAAYVLDFARACGIAWKRKKAQQQRSQAPIVVDELAKKKDLLLERCETLKNQQVMQRVFYEYMTDLGQRQLGKYNPVNPEMLFDHRDDDWQTSALFNIARVLEAYRDDKQMDPPYLS